MQSMLENLQGQTIVTDNDALEKFYDSVRKRAADIDNAEGKQRIIIELYDKFFKTAFPKMVEQLGIVYTPVEVVDFIIHSVNDILNKEFGRSLSDQNVHILDPFTGTGTFITRLLQSGLINQKDLQRKYKQELYANEIVLLAYYIAAINIENAYHDSYTAGFCDDEFEIEEQTDFPFVNDEHLSIAADPAVLYKPKNDIYEPFEGICLTDTFQLSELNGNESLFSEVFPQNSERVERQLKAPLRVIIGNPPYSKGQKSANDNAQNQSYKKLDSRISETYALGTNATNKNALYNPYLKAFRWSSDRLSTTGGIIAFVTDGGWLDNSSMNGFRKSIEKEFSSIYVFNLRGDQRTSGELSRKEGGKIFGSGSRSPIAITLLVKNPGVNKQYASIYYKDIGDYLSREEKLKIIKSHKTFDNSSLCLNKITPNEHGDWLSLRNEGFRAFLAMAPDKKFDRGSSSFFIINSLGVLTSRDNWLYNSSLDEVKKTSKATVDFYNSEVIRFLEKKAENEDIETLSFINKDPKKISWSSSLIPNLQRGKFATYENEKIVRAAYRPFNKLYLYFGDKMIHRKGQFEQLFPADSPNVIICISGIGGSKQNSVFITNLITDINILDASTQCFPLYYYEENVSMQKTLFDSSDQEKYVQRDAISDFILDQAKKQYGKTVTKEDIFYYVYGFLHNKQYRETFANDLKKMFPRLPLVNDVRDFWAISKAGRKLAHLHLDYENIPPCPNVLILGDEDRFYHVEKMRFNKNQKNTIIYNSKITITDIPIKAYSYIINGKSAIEWIMERYQISTHKDSGIKNDPNGWANEVGNPRYILDLLLSIINVSIQTVDIIESLPKLSFEQAESDIDIENNIDKLDQLKINHEPSPTDMREFSLNEGIYFINDVVQITRLNRDKVTRWFKELSKENYEGLSGTQQSDVNKMRISFYGLIELVVIGTLRENGFTLKKILTARHDLKSITNKVYPFATNNVRDDLKVAGNSILFELADGVVTLNGTSQFNLDIIRSFFANIEFDTQGLAQQLFPVKDSKLIVVDPKQGGGKAVINNGSGTWAETVASAYDGPDSIEMLCMQYDITKEQIQAAVEYLN